MEITEVKVILKEGPDKKLKAYATLTFDNSFVVRNVKIIKGNKGLFVAMPSRKMRESCPKCNYKNAIRSKFCNQCGSNLPAYDTRTVSPEARQSEHRDIAHPITLECREYIQKKVLTAYEAEAEHGNSSQAPEVSVQAKPASPKADTPEITTPKKEPAKDEGDITL
ncbi:MAG: septation protein SpoVG family protein [Candidatus Omnitrophica bacterium]|nr:septation protein SpoVG family protein [Candidatus Omnitrophota bacterium]